MTDSPPKIEKCHDTKPRKDSEPLDRPSPASSRQSSADQQGECKSDRCDEAENTSSHTSPATSTFAQTRSPPPVVDADQSSNRTSPSDDDCKNAADCSKSGVSPFMQSFMAVDTKSSFFSTRRVTPILRLKTPSQETGETRRISGTQTTIPGHEAATMGDTSSNTSGKSVTSLEESDQEDCVREEDVQDETSTPQKATEQDDQPQELVIGASTKHTTEEEMANKDKDDSATVKVAKAQDAAIMPAVLEILEGAVDRRIAQQLTTAPLDARRLISLSSPAPYIPPFEEPVSPQTSWGINLCRVLKEHQPPVLEYNQLPIHPLSIEVTRSPSPEELVKESIQELLEDTVQKEQRLAPHHETMLATTSDEDQRDTSNVLAIGDDLSNTVITRQTEDGQPACTVVLEASEESPHSAIEHQNPRNSPSGSEQLLFRPDDNEDRTVQADFLAAYNWPSEHHVQDKCIAEDETSKEAPKKRSDNSSSTPGTDGSRSTDSELPTIVLSSPSDTSETGLGMRISTSSNHIDVSANDEPDTRVEQFHTLLNRELREFKDDFLQQLNSMFNENTSRWNATRNSIAATIIAHPSINEALSLLEDSIKLEISDKQGEVLSRLGMTHSELLQRSGKVAKAMKKHSRELADDLKTAIIEHIDERLEELKDNQVTVVFNIADEQARKKDQIEVSVAEKDANEDRTTTHNISAVTEQIKSLILTTSNDISEKLDRSNDHARTEQNQNVAVVGAMQRAIIDNLQQIMYHSTLQNLAINDLSSAVTPLNNLVKGISHDTTLIDAKLAKNAAVLTAVTEQAEKLENTATLFDKIVANARIASKLEHAESGKKLLARVTEIAAANNGSDITAKIEALQDQMVWMKQQLGRIIELLTTTEPTETAIPDNRGPLSLRTAIDRRGSELGYISAADSSSSELLNDSTELPTISTRATFEFEFQKRKELKFPYSSHLTLSDLHSVKNLVSKTRSIWTKYLTEQGVSSVEIELISIWLPATSIAGRRLVDNDTAYNGWYKAATTSHINEHRPLLEIEFLVREKDSSYGSDEPRSKKRKQEEMRRDSVEDLEFRFGVWEAGRPTKYI